MDDFCYNLKSFPETIKRPGEPGYADAPDPSKDEVWWSNRRWPPSVGTRVRCNINGIGPGEVTGYFIEYGWLGLYVRLDKETRPKWHKRQNPKVDYAMIFGLETEWL